MNVWIILAQVYPMNAKLLLYRQRQRKRKRNDRDVDLAAIMDAGCDRAITRMKRLDESFTLGEVKARLPSELQVMSLPYNQVLRVAIKLVKDTNMLHIWCTLDHSHKSDFIKMYIDGT